MEVHPFVGETVFRHRSMTVHHKQCQCLQTYCLQKNFVEHVT